MKLKIKPDFKINTTLFIWIAVVYMELILKLFTCSRFFDMGLLLMPIFSLVPSLIITAVCARVKPILAKGLTIGSLSVLSLIYIIQAVYHGFFGKYFIFYSLLAGGVGQVTGNGMLSSTLSAVASAAPAILLLLIPLVLYCIFGNRLIAYRRMKWSGTGISVAAAVTLHLSALLIISFSSNLSALQSAEFDPNLAVGKFGVLRTEVLDIKYNVLGFVQDVDIDPEKPIIVETVAEPDDSYTEEPSVDTSPNALDIDFNLLNKSTPTNAIRTLNTYFSQKEPTLKNAYTGMYEGYNLITVTAEAFSPYAIDPELTPTLYKMAQDGFKFENFYTPIWGVSTSDGEYCACTGLLPKSGVWSFYKSASNYMPYTLGNMFQSIGVTKTFAYHNHNATYYRRDLSHPNMGYTFNALDIGLEEYVKPVWPASDLEMVAGSTKDYLSDSEPFHVYYMTVSGHLQYSFNDNSIALKNKEYVEHLDCSETLKAYYACNIELDRAMEKLLADLNAAGVADKTVIAITPDHYPYGLAQPTNDHTVWTELLGHPVDTTFELYESCLLLYCQSTENAPTVTKPCSAVDVLPTLLNLFGFEYDSRLLIGTDIMSTHDCIVQFNDRSFITSKGKYNANTGEFTLNEGQQPFESEAAQTEYIENVKTIVNNRFKISAAILDNDYYRYLFDSK